MKKLCDKEQKKIGINVAQNPLDGISGQETRIPINENLDASRESPLNQFMEQQEALKRREIERQIINSIMESSSDSESCLPPSYLPLPVIF